MLNLDSINIPVMIVSSPRTGSTELANQIHNKFKDARVFIEPDYDGEKKIKEFEEYSRDSNNFIIKIHASNFNRYDQSLLQRFITSPDVYRIRIKRRNIAKQIASYYIANYGRSMTWHYFNHSTKPEYIEIDPSEMDNTIKTIKYCNKKLDSTQIDYHLDLVYEDILPFTDNKYIITPSPLNYDEILNYIQQRI